MEKKLQWKCQWQNYNFKKHELKWKTKHMKNCNWKTELKNKNYYKWKWNGIKN
jgi:hypothetical protein